MRLQHSAVLGNRVGLGRWQLQGKETYMEEDLESVKSERGTGLKKKTE